MVRTYWFLPGFNEASGNLDLQPVARIDYVEACRPRAMSRSIVGRPRWGSKTQLPMARILLRVWSGA